MLKLVGKFTAVRQHLLKSCSYTGSTFSTLSSKSSPLKNDIFAQKQLKINKSEYKAVVALICRSIGVNEREFHTSITSCSAEKKNGNNGSRPPRRRRRESPFAKQQPTPPPPPASSSNDGSEGSNDKGKPDENDEKVKSVLTKAIFLVFTIYMFITFMTILFSGRGNSPETTTRYVSWNEFVHHMLAAGEVKEIIIRPDMEMVTIILHEGAIIKGRKVTSNIFHMAVADATKFEEKLRDVEKRLGIPDGVSITYDRQSDITGRLLTLLIIFGVVMAVVTRMKGFKNPISMDSFSQMGRAKFTLVDPFDGGRGVLFKDVAGLQEAKQEVKEFIDYLKSPEKYQRLGAKVPKGALLLGPPGCGKTLLAKAVATEAQVPFLSMNGSEFIEMIGGLGAARVRDLFQEAKKRSPCIIYIDEIDAIGRQRSGVGGGGQGGGGGGGSGESEQTLNQLLVEMDGMASKEGVLMLASTNRADILDNALLRPGRFDRHIMIDLPNLVERREIFEKHLSGISLELEPKIYTGRLARLTPGFSGADIANVCNEAALHAARNSQKIVTSKNLEYAVERLVGGTEKRSHALSPVERKVIAYHESGHALVGWLLPSSDVLLKVTIVPRTSLALGFAQYTPSEQKLFTKEELFDKMCMALGGRAAESLTFDRITTGAQNDLEKVTKIAQAQVKKFGMSDSLGPMYIVDENDGGGGGTEKSHSKALDAVIDAEVRNIVTLAYSKTEKILQDNKDKLKLLAEALLEKETLNYEEVVALIGPPLYESAKRMIEPVDFEDSIKNLSGDLK